MARLQQIAHGLFGDLADEYYAEKNCGGPGEEYYPDATVGFQAERGVRPDDVTELLLDNGWTPISESRQRLLSPDGNLDVSYSWTRTPGVPYRFVSVHLHVVHDD